MEKNKAGGKMGTGEWQRWREDGGRGSAGKLILIYTAHCRAVRFYTHDPDL